MNRALLVLVGVSCRPAPAPAPAPRVHDAREPARSICPQEPNTLNLLLPDLVTDMTLEVDAPAGVRPARWHGRMVIDGTVTDATWPEQPPRVYALADGRRVLYDAYSENASYLWDPATRTLTPLGKVMPISTGQRGYMLARYTEEEYVYGDVDPRRPALRELLRVPASKHVQMLGELDGAMVALEMRYSDYASAALDKRRAASLYCISGPEKITKRAFSLPAGLSPVADAFREHRMLMRGPSNAGEASSGQWMPPFTVDVYIVDLDRRGHARKIGTVRGSYTHNTAIPHPYANVMWGPPPPPTGRLSFGDNVTHYVDPVTETIR